MTTSSKVMHESADSIDSAKDTANNAEEYGNGTKYKLVPFLVTPTSQLEIA